jgi:hypothetical protein
MTRMSSPSTPLQESASPRFRELLKEFHNLNDEVGIMGERDRYAEMVGRLPVFDNILVQINSAVLSVAGKKKAESL